MALSLGFLGGTRCLQCNSISVVIFEISAWIMEYSGISIHVMEEYTKVYLDRDKPGAYFVRNETVYASLEKKNENMMQAIVNQKFIEFDSGTRVKLLPRGLED